MTPNYQLAGIKTKTEAFKKIISDILNNPACAGSGGECSGSEFRSERLQISLLK